MAIITVVFLCVSFYFFIAVSGELVLENSPVCANDTALYRCTGSNRFQWTWTNSNLSFSESIGLFPGLIKTGVRNRTIGGTTVSFNVTDVAPPVTNVIATVYNSQVLNGTRIECGGHSLIISITTIDLQLTTLSVSKNGSEIIIVPNVAGGISGLQYQLSGDTLREVIQPIIVNSTENITFIQCKETILFTIDTCLLDDEVHEERNYTLFSNGTWTVSRSCGDIRVKCINGNWSKDIICPESSTGIPVNFDSSLPTSSGSTGTTPVPGTTHHAVWIGVAIASVLAIIVFTLVVLVVVLLCMRMKSKKIALEEIKPNNLEEDSNEYSTLTHPTAVRSVMPADYYDTINSGFTARQPPEAPSYGLLNGNAATGQNRTQNTVQVGDQNEGQNRFQDRDQDTDSDTASHHYDKTKHIPQKSKTGDMMYSEVALGDQATFHPHLTTKNSVQYSTVQHKVKPEDSNLNLDSLLIQLRPVTDQYQELGVVAGFSQETIEEITSHVAVAFDGQMEVCDAWIRLLRRQDTNPTWRAASEMLKKIGQEKLARDLLKVYTTGSLPVVVDMYTVEIPKQATQSPPPPAPQRNDVDVDEEGEVAMATVVSLRRDRVPTESEESPPPIPPFHPIEDQAMAVPPRPPKKRASQPGAPAIPPKILPSKSSPNPTPEAIPSLPLKPNKKA